LTSRLGQLIQVKGWALRVLVTGGAGFIGSNFVRRIVDGSLAGINHVTILDKLTYAGTLSNLEMLPKGSFEFVKGDIADSNLVDLLAPGHDAIINFAAESHVDRSITGASDFVETNILGTQNLLASALKNGVKTFIQISTDEVYGSIDNGSWTEDYPLLPNSPYSASKASADLMVRSYHRTFGLDTRITRCSNNYGKHQFPEKLIPLFVTNLIDHMNVPLYGKGINVRDWLHVDDHCRGIHAVLTKGKSGEIYNIGGGQELTNIELTSIILEKMGRDESSINYVQDRPGHDYRYSVSIEKISSQLGYKPKVSFKEGIVETIEWYKANEKWWRPLKNH
jgi:dTDP-glucose 4,6-dehydratase